MENVSLTAAEWNVMECLWERSPLTVMELVALLRERAGWAKSTTTTMITRMSGKGLIHCGENEKPKRYFPLVQREDAVESETKSFVDRVFRGSVGLMMNAVVERQELSQEEVEQLYAILDKAGGGKK